MGAGEVKNPSHAMIFTTLRLLSTENAQAGLKPLTGLGTSQIQTATWPAPGELGQGGRVMEMGYETEQK